MSEEKSYRSTPKKEYLLRKMLDGAKALYEFFEVMSTRNESFSSTIYLSNQLAAKYGLTANQRSYFNNVAERTAMAQAYLRTVIEKFGLNPDGSFKNPEAVYKVFCEEDEAKIVRAIPEPLAIQFTREWDGRDSAGYTHALDPKNDLKGLIYFVPTPEDRENATLKEIKEVLEEFGIDIAITSDMANRRFENTKAHERRHIIDNIMGRFPYETQAHLFAGMSVERYRGWDRDKNNLSETLESLVRYENARYFRKSEEGEPTLKEIASMKKGMIDSVTFLDCNYWNFLRTINQLKDLGVNNKVASFLFSTMTKEKVLKRLDELKFLAPGDIVVLDERGLVGGRK